MTGTEIFASLVAPGKSITDSQIADYAWPEQNSKGGCQSALGQKKVTPNV